MFMINILIIYFNKLGLDYRFAYDNIDRLVVQMNQLMKN